MGGASPRQEVQDLEATAAQPSPPVQPSTSIPAAITALKAAAKFRKSAFALREKRSSTVPGAQQGKRALRVSVMKVAAVEGFNDALHVSEERAGLSIVARAQGVEEEARALLVRGEFRRCKQLLFGHTAAAGSTEGSTEGGIEGSIEGGGAGLSPVAGVAESDADDDLEEQQWSMRAIRERASTVSAYHISAIHLVDLCLDDEPFAQGGGGFVYKGTYKGQSVVAKCHINDVDPGDLVNEVLHLSRIVHANIIK